MRRYSPPYYSPPRRGYGERGRSPPRRSPPRRSPPRRGYGGHGGRREPTNGSLLVRNIPLSSRPEDLRAPFERFGPVRDVYMPKDYYTGEPRGFAFVEFVDPYDAAEAQYRMNGQRFGGRVLTVVVAAETRKRPEEMRHRDRRGRSGYNDRRSSYHGHSRSRSRSPRYSLSSRRQDYSRSPSPLPTRRDDYSPSPQRRSDQATPPRDGSHGRELSHDRRSFSPRNGDTDQNHAGNGYAEKPSYESDADDARVERKSPRRASVSPYGSRSRSVDISPRRSG